METLRIIYVNVAVTVSDASTTEREFGNLEEISDNYEKTVVTLRDSAPNTQNGIRMLWISDGMKKRMPEDVAEKGIRGGGRWCGGGGSRLPGC